MASIVIGMDPAGTGERDETGLVAVARGMDGLDYVLGDWSKQIAGNAAAKRAWEMHAAYGAKWLIVETNMAKRWVLDVLAQEWKARQKAGLAPAGHPPPIKTVNSYVGKQLRAEPVAARYEQGRWRHVTGQGLADLETQMISWVPLEIVKGAIRPRRNDSPDRIDALVHAGLWLASLERSEVGAVSPVLAQLPVTTLSPLG
jgi:phage terminase large subunit-like protein